MAFLSSHDKKIENLQLQLQRDVVQLARERTEFMTRFVPPENSYDRTPALISSSRLEGHDSTLENLILVEYIAISERHLESSPSRSNGTTTRTNSTGEAVKIKFIISQIFNDNLHPYFNGDSLFHLHERCKTISRVLIDKAKRRASLEWTTEHLEELNLHARYGPKYSPINMQLIFQGISRSFPVINRCYCISESHHLIQGLNLIKKTEKGEWSTGKLQYSFKVIINYKI